MDEPIHHDPDRHADSPWIRPADETAWLAGEARIYRGLSLQARLAWFRDIERCMWALAGPGAAQSRDGDVEVSRRWRDPLSPDVA